MTDRTLSIADPAPLVPRAATNGTRTAQPRRIAVVTAHNEERTVTSVLNRLSHLVDEALIVEDGSTDQTRSDVRAWLSGTPTPARMLAFEQRQGTSAAYHLAFTELCARLDAGQLSPQDLVFTVDASGQHDLDVLEDLRRRAVNERLDALVTCRDLAAYPFYKQLGNALLSAWASLWAGGVRLHDVESGYRVLRLGALADALQYYRGHDGSENVEAAIVLSRLGYRVRNDILVPVPFYRSRTDMGDALTDFASIPLAALRVNTRRPKARHVPSLTTPIAATAAAAIVGLLALRRVWRLLFRR